ncbi:hypothetical protein CEUSTIGMA_g9182.t1 [Chlamydomonas eustigma]|uniref:Uncharacterized protein n=1 Tax=Chlamydomonas eustigma TaxID=1157962 RepID=A0A250XF95_9CHLO|nr:hypothetical protein CEUSTIGMA_g9182.t1 [Chlamydomonas eustigma]|eukprot:GAX81754.1 hypothetical protein CEUSTIGMA_g9182.t1 [Chlamydomonas eustigma]
MRLSSHAGLRVIACARGYRLAIDQKDRHRYTHIRLSTSCTHSHRRSCKVFCSPQLVAVQIEETAKELWTRLGNSEPLQPESCTVTATHSAAPVIPQQITRHNFESALPYVREALMNCSFFAFDCEFSGIATEVLNPVLVQFDDPNSRYERILRNAKTYQIVQFGVSTFTWSAETGNYTCRTFNFNIFPAASLEVRFGCQASSMSFLASQGFDFNRWIYDGIPYRPLSLPGASVPKANYGLTPNQRHAPGAVQQLKKSIKEQSPPAAAAMSPATSNNTTITNIDNNVAEEALESDDEVVGADMAPILLNSEEMLDDRHVNVLSRHKPADCGMDGGFTQVLEMMRACGRPAVAHNALNDLVYMLQHFTTPALPPRWSDFKNVVSCWLPGGVYDTKAVAVHLSHEAHRTVGPQQGLFGGHTYLGQLHDSLLPGGTVERFLAPRLLVSPHSSPASSSGLMHSEQAGPGIMPEVTHAPGYNMYSSSNNSSSSSSSTDSNEMAHEAGYDAFMTGSAFCRLLRLAELIALPVGSSLPPLVTPSSSTQNLSTSSSSSLPPMITVQRPNPIPGQELTKSTSELNPRDGASVQTSLETTTSKTGYLPPLRWVEPLLGRINPLGLDVPYLDLRGPEPDPVRPTVFHISSVYVQTRIGDIFFKLGQAGMGKSKVAWIPHHMGSAYKSGFLQVSSEEAAKKLPSVMAATWPTWRVVPYAEYLAEKKRRAEKEYGAGVWSRSVNAEFLSEKNLKTAEQAQPLNRRVSDGQKLQAPVALPDPSRNSTEAGEEQGVEHRSRKDGHTGSDRPRLYRGQRASRGSEVERAEPFMESSNGSTLGRTNASGKKWKNNNPAERISDAKDYDSGLKSKGSRQDVEPSKAAAPVLPPPPPPPSEEEIRALAQKLRQLPILNNSSLTNSVSPPELKRPESL